MRIVSRGKASPYEVRCPRCDVSFPVETTTCIHCGGPTGEAAELFVADDGMDYGTGPDEVRFGSNPIEPEPSVSDSALGALRDAGIEVTTDVLAEEADIDINTIEGTGKDGRILKCDVEKVIIHGAETKSPDPEKAIAAAPLLREAATTDGLADCDLVIEAVVENPEVKKSIFSAGDDR